MHTYETVSVSTSRSFMSSHTRDQEIDASGRAGGSGPSSASSSAVTAGCSAGLFRPYVAHQATSTSAGSVVQASARCQSKADMSQAISGGAREAPTPRPMLCRPCTTDHRSGVNQASNTPVDTRSEERRVGKECRCRGARYHEEKKTQ